MKRTIFIATNILKDEQTGQHLMTGTGSDGERYYTFELSREVANEIAQKMDIQIIIIKKNKTWHDDSNADLAEAENGKLQLNANTMLHAEA
jgi:hypothetical protein